MKRYAVPANAVVLDRMTIELITGIVGTVRGWFAKAVAGRKAVQLPSDVSAGTPEQRLRQLQELHKGGLICAEEYNKKRSAILNGFDGFAEYLKWPRLVIGLWISFCSVHPWGIRGVSGAALRSKVLFAKRSDSAWSCRKTLLNES